MFVCLFAGGSGRLVLLSVTWKQKLKHNGTFMLCNKIFPGDMLHSCLLTLDREPKTDTVSFPSESVALTFFQVAWLVSASFSLACLRVFCAGFIADSGRKGPCESVSFRDFLKYFVLFAFSIEENLCRIEYFDRRGKSLKHWTRYLLFNSSYF